MAPDRSTIPETVKYRAAERDAQKRGDMLALHGIGAQAINDGDAPLHSATTKLTQALLRSDFRIIDTLTQEERASLENFRGESPLLLNSGDLHPAPDVQAQGIQEPGEEVERVKAALFDKYPPVKAFLEDPSVYTDIGDGGERLVALKHVSDLVRNARGRIVSAAAVSLWVSKALGEIEGKEGQDIQTVRLPVKGRPSAIRGTDFILLLGHLDERMEKTRAGAYRLRTELNAGDLGRIKKN